MSRLSLAVMAALLAVGGISGQVCAQDDGVEVKVLVKNRIYYPRPMKPEKKYKKIGLLQCKKVLDATPEYKEIAKRELDPDSAEYHILVKRASDRFKKAIKRAVSSDGFDLLAETGAITVEGRSLPDVSDTVVKHLSAN